jgi:hypothetical protein
VRRAREIELGSQHIERQAHLRALALFLIRGLVIVGVLLLLLVLAFAITSGSE